PIGRVCATRPASVSPAQTRPIGARRPIGRVCAGDTDAGLVAPGGPDVPAFRVPVVRVRHPRDASRHQSCSGGGSEVRDLWMLVRTAIWLAFFGALYQEL